MEKESQKLKIGLALGSGGFRGLAHIGVIKGLEENNIPIDLIAGSSIGALIGGFYAAGFSIKEIEQIALSGKWRGMFSFFSDPSFLKGLIKGKKLRKFIEDYIGNKNFEDCKIPFAAVATDLKTGEVIIFKEGSLSEAIRASMSIPLIFKPVEIGGRILVDGGLSIPVPVEIVKKMGADIVIAVNLNKQYYDENWKSGWYDIANDSLNILRHHLARFSCKEADITIEIDTGKSRWYHFLNGGHFFDEKENISLGEKTVTQILSQIKEVIARKLNN